jgi:hypothetical protein
MGANVSIVKPGEVKLRVAHIKTGSNPEIKSKAYDLNHFAMLCTPPSPTKIPYEFTLTGSEKPSKVSTIITLRAH